ncbi:MAG: DUF1211 domain-containing protein [Bacteroidetes bacterium]|nr:DUF1211 domain-containing protein [Bacteroidota bacterium]
MTVHEDQDLKREFQVERLALFSDAVFAIAITLLVIELKIPELHAPHTDRHLLEIMSQELVAKFIGVIVSFLVIAMYWINHHLLCGYLENYNKRLLWANVYFLFTIVLMPFSSGFYSEYWLSGLITPVAFYTLNLVGSGLLLIRLWKIITDPKNKLCHNYPSPEKIRFHKMRSLIAPVVFVISLIIAFIDPVFSYYVPLGIPLVLLAIRLYYRKKNPAILQ